MEEKTMNCDECKRKAEEKEPAQVPFYVFESVQCRQEHEMKQQRILTGAIAALGVLTNAAWILHYFGVF